MAKTYTENEVREYIREALKINVDSNDDTKINKLVDYILYPSIEIVDTINEILGKDDECVHTYEIFHSPKINEYQQLRNLLILGYILAVSNGETRDNFESNIAAIIERYIYDPLNIRLFDKWYHKINRYNQTKQYELQITHDLKYSLFWEHYDTRDGENYTLTGDCKIVVHDTLQLLIPSDPSPSLSSLNKHKEIHSNKHFRYCVAQIYNKNSMRVHNPRNGQIWETFPTPSK